MFIFTRKELLESGLKQEGVIVYGNGMNAKTYRKDALKEGWVLIEETGFCELWR